MGKANIEAVGQQDVCWSKSKGDRWQYTASTQHHIPLIPVFPQCSVEPRGYDGTTRPGEERA